MEIVYRNLNELIPYEKNAKKHDKTQIDRIAKSLDRYGWKQPCVIDKNNVLIVGHGRVLGAKKSKKWCNQPVPCILADDLTEEEIKEFRLIDNKLNESEWDIELLEVELQEIDFDMTEFGFEVQQVDEVIEDEPPEVDETGEPMTHQGEVWQLGRHRLMCGDSTKQEDVEKLTGGLAMDMLITDPPYNVSYTGKTKDALTIQNDTQDDESFRGFLTDAFAAADYAMKPGGVFYIWHADSEGFNFRYACKAVGWTVRQCLVWNKNSMVMGRQDYQWKHEPCLYGWKEGAGHLWASDRKQTTVINYDRPTRNELHPTMKPVGLFDYQIQNNTKGGDAVLDLFAGSGTTIMACEQNGRNAYCMELDPRYCDVIIQRWEAFTGDKAKLIKKGDEENV